MRCVVAAGEVAEITSQGLLLKDGSVWPHDECELQVGAILRFYYTDNEQENIMPQPAQPPAHVESAETHAAEPSASVPAAKTDAIPTEAATVVVAETEPKPATDEQPHEATTAVPDAAHDVTAAADAAAKLGGDYAPLVAIVLAAIAVLGGSKAWSFYKERSSQKHELALKQLEVQAQVNAPTVQPPPCQVAQAKVDAQLLEHSAKLSELERKAAAAERKAASLPDVDVGELDERVAKLEKAAKRKP